ncbi:Di-trans-poly-cis-decaprenylcistransferase [Vararia minispora EC-137]|uniref:Di-trans-poly-cis-decaprenylcistransferase n=1 Tax=Vararia minispora EC-137 TaxID=1314806 RepID=A0ACB8QNZ7_9AGAM|nr:Di-trans-poly-cis-decaprenylcistransferase [Vararia minispora EC-137]
MAAAYASSSIFRARERLVDLFQRAVVAALRTGPIPRHVAFVMDGNRRYARSLGVRVVDGHVSGYYALRRVLEILYLLGVEHVTAYAFAIDNFKRTPEEVDALMSLAQDRLIEFCEHGGVLREYGVRLVAVGNISLCPPGVQDAIRRAEEMTKDNTRAVFNLCISYASRDEITTAVNTTVNEKLASQSPTPITVADLDAHMMTARGNSPPLDIFVRTSGVLRLSDFLLWQCNEDTQIQFIRRYWPEIGLLDIIPILLDYQRKVWSKPASES